MRCSLVDSLEWVYPDSAVGPRPCRTLGVDVARGGTAAVTILVAGAEAAKPLRVDVGGAGGWPVELYRLVDVPVEANTGPVGFTEKEGERNPHVTRRAPFRVFDAMRPVGARFAAGAPTVAVRVHVRVPEDARAGKRTVLLTVSQGRETCELALDVTVHAVRIPPVGRASWPVTNWFSYGNIASRHGLKPWSEAHWAMLGRYARLMARGRQNTFWVPFQDVFALREGRPVLDRARLRRIVATFTRAGVPLIEGGHFGGRSTSEWTCPTFSVALTKNLATSAEGNADIAAFARQLVEEIGRNGWRGRYVQHVTDEPIPENAVDYRIFVGMVRKYMPGIPIVDAVLDPSLSGSVDIWCPQVQHYQKDRERFEAVRALGDRVWFYTCCFPGGPWLNRLLDMELVRGTLLGWAGARYRLDGFLHWGLNHYQKGQDPFEKNVIPCWGGSTNSLPAGDTHVIYPGEGAPWSSVRFEAQREGWEDLELLRQLDAASPRGADAVMRPVVRAFDDYTKDARVLRAARRKLLGLLGQRVRRIR